MAHGAHHFLQFASAKSIMELRISLAASYPLKIALYLSVSKASSVTYRKRNKDEHGFDCEELINKA